MLAAPVRLGRCVASLLLATVLVLPSAVSTPSRSEVVRPQFDPPFAFPGLSVNVSQSGPPSEYEFSNSCFQFIYGFLHKAGDSSSLAQRAERLPKEMLSTCRQADKHGCERFADQLKEVIKAKLQAPTAKESSLSSNAKPGEHVSKAEAAKLPTAKATVGAAPTATPKHHFHLHQHHSVNSAALLPKSQPTTNTVAVTDEKKVGLLLKNSDRKTNIHSYKQWCSRMYTVAISSLQTTTTTTTTTTSTTSTTTTTTPMVTTTVVAKTVKALSSRSKHA